MDGEIRTVCSDDISLYGLSVSQVPLNHLLSPGNFNQHSIKKLNPISLVKSNSIAILSFYFFLNLLIVWNFLFPGQIVEYEEGFDSMPRIIIGSTRCNSSKKQLQKILKYCRSHMVPKDSILLMVSKELYLLLRSYFYQNL